jgi:hypothetical protein
MKCFVFLKLPMPVKIRPQPIGSYPFSLLTIRIFRKTEIRMARFRPGHPRTLSPGANARSEVRLDSRTQTRYYRVFRSNFRRIFV